MTAAQVPCPTGKATKLDWRQVLSLSSANFSQAVMLTAPFTIGVFMVRDFQAAAHGGQEGAVNEQVVGRLTGLLAGIFSFASFVTAYAWGAASNYIGRRPVIIIGNVVSFVSILWFGASTTYATAMAARAFGGFFNGILGAWKCMISESTDVSMQGKFFGWLSLAWGLGCIAGPFIGGVFSRPCEHFRGLGLCGAGQLFQTRPFLLACLISSLTILAATVFSAVFLQETLPPQHRRRFAGLPWLRRLLAWPWRRGQQQQQDQDVGGQGALSAGAQQAGGAGGVVPGAEADDPLATQPLLRTAKPGGSSDAPGWLSSAAEPDGDDSSSSGATGRAPRPAKDGASRLEACDGDDSSSSSGGGSSALQKSVSSRTYRAPFLFRLASRAYIPRTLWARQESMQDEDCGRKSAQGVVAAGAPTELSLLLRDQPGGRSDAAAAAGTTAGDGGSGAVAPAHAPSPALSTSPALEQQPAGALQLSKLSSSAQPAQPCIPNSVGVALEVVRQERCGGGDPPEDGPCQREDCSPLADGGLLPGRRGGDTSRSDDASGGGDGGDDDTQRLLLLQQVPAPGATSRLEPGGLLVLVPRVDGKVQPGGDGDGSSPCSPWRVALAPSRPQSDATLPPSPTAGGCQGAVVRDDSTAGQMQRHETQQQRQQEEGQQLQGPGGAVVNGDDAGASISIGVEPEEEAGRAARSIWYRDRTVVLTILGYGLTALLYCALDETFPIYAAAPVASGGLGMRENELAAPLMFFGVILMVYSVWGYPWLQCNVGTLRMTRIGMACSAVVILVVPLVSVLLAGSRVFAMVVLYFSMVLKAFAQCSAFTGAIIMVNAAPSPDQLGDVNGVGQTLAAFVRGIGPALGGILWAASLGLHVPGHQFLTFAVIALVAVGNWFLFGHVSVRGLK